MKNPILIFILCFLVIFSFFYFYPADIFEVQIIDNGIIFTKEITIQQILSQNNFTDSSSFIAFESLSPTVKGWFMILAIFIALPIMISYRTTLKKYPRRSNENKQ